MFGAYSARVVHDEITDNYLVQYLSSYNVQDEPQWTQFTFYPDKPSAQLLAAQIIMGAHPQFTTLYKED